MEVKKMDFKPVITKASLALQRNEDDFRGLVLEEPKSSVRTKKEVSLLRKSIDKNTTKEENVFDIKKARQEILNFAISNQRSQKNQKKMLIYQMVQLGAKPPKKTYKNYKELLEERKRLKNIREERKKLNQLGKNQTGVASVKCRSKAKMDKKTRKKPPVVAIDQHYGVVKPKLK